MVKRLMKWTDLMGYSFQAWPTALCRHPNGAINRHRACPGYRAFI